MNSGLNPLLESCGLLRIGLYSANTPDPGNGYTGRS